MTRKKDLRQQIVWLTLKLGQSQDSVFRLKDEYEQQKQNYIDSYNSKVQDFARETLRYSELHQRVSKLYSTIKESAFNQFYREVILLELEQVLDPKSSNQIDPGTIRVGEPDLYSPKHGRV